MLMRYEVACLNGKDTIFSLRDVLGVPSFAELANNGTSQVYMLSLDL